VVKEETQVKREMNVNRAEGYQITSSTTQRQHASPVVTPFKVIQGHIMPVTIGSQYATSY